MSALRSRFLWICATVALLGVLTLRHFTYFDFGSDGRLVSELFLSGVSFSAGLISIGLSLSLVLWDRRRGSWELILAGATRPTELIAGIACAIVAIQELLALGLTIVFVTWMAALDQQLSSDLAGILPAALLAIACLTCFHIAIAVCFQETWALILMVGGFLLGHLSDFLHGADSPAVRAAGSLVYCVIPDMESLGMTYLDLDRLDSGFYGALGVSSLAYCVAMVACAALVLSRFPAVRRG